ncbi:30S ribosomal protein S9 [Patescibacteria group bacterium]
MADKSKVKKNLITATGKRKTAVARVFLEQKKGKILVNDKDINEVLNTEKNELAWKKPFHLIGVSHPETQFNVTIKTHGSGKSSQVGAIMHGLSRALAKISEENQVILSRAGMLTRDSRMVERKKPYLRKARKRPQYSKR